MFGPFAVAGKRNFPYRLLIHIVLFVFVFLWGTSLGLLKHPELGFDKMLHLFGGYICGMIGVLFFSCLSYTYFCGVKQYNTCLLFITLLTALLVGGGWEILQSLFPIMRGTIVTSVWDTTGDMVFDMIGGLFAGKYFKKTDFV